MTTLTRYERDEIERRIGVFADLFEGEITALVKKLSKIIKDDPNMVDITVDFISGFYDLVSELQSEVEKLAEQVAEPHPFESMETTGRL